MKNLEKFYLYISKIKNFLHREGFLEVYPPPLVENPGMETHIHPYQVYSPYEKKLLPFYLHTSPEFNLKRFLSQSSLSSLYSLQYAFRDEPMSPIHRNQFLLLEIYERRKNHFKKVQDLTYDLIRKAFEEFNQEQPPLVRKTMAELFQEILNQDLFFLLKKKEKLEEYVQKILPEVFQKNLLKEDLFFLLFLNKIEPELKKYPIFLLEEFPAEFAALSQLKNKDVSYRFEFYVHGYEIANGFLELQDLSEHKKRFQEQASLKKELYHYELNEPKLFYEALERGLPFCTGIAIGLERLFFSIEKQESFFFE